MTTAVLLTLCLIILPVDACAQSTGSIAGRVLDQTSLVLPGVTVDLIAGG